MASNKQMDSTSKRKVRRIYWHRIFIFCAIILILLVTVILTVTKKKQFSNSEATNSETEIKVEVEDEEGTETNPHNQIVFLLTEEEKLILGRCLKNETCSMPFDYLSIEEKTRYMELNKIPKPSEEQKNEIAYWEETFNTRYDLAQQLTASAILNRIGKEGFGRLAFIEPGYKSKDLLDVIEQDSQFAGILEKDFPIDSRTMNNIEKVICGDTIIKIPENLFFEISYFGKDKEGAEADLLGRMDPATRSVHVFQYIPCSYQGKSGLEDHIQVFGINSTGTGFGSPDP